MRFSPCYDLPSKNQILITNYEIQSNIRAILKNLRKQHPGLKLIAVEGATGIIPTLDIARIPDSEAKRAVIDYFMREGKLTGADCLAVCDDAKVELFGAENNRLYMDSLELVKKYVTEENRGIIFDLMSQIDLLRARQYNPELLAFEQRRTAVILGQMDADDYHRSLVQQARRLQLSTLPPDWQTDSFFGNIDLQDRMLQDQYLEKIIRGWLAKTPAEKQLLAYQYFVEAAEHILTVSASQDEVDSYIEESQHLSLAKIQKNIQTALAKLNLYAGFDPNFNKEVAGLEPAIQQGLKFYQLAEQRNQALFEQAVNRAISRNDQKLVLITGGYHTQAISRLARQQGYSCVTVRPRQEKPDNSNNYFDLLLNPEQPTELENMVAQIQPRARAINTMNSLVIKPVHQRIINAIETFAEEFRSLGSKLKSGVVKSGEYFLTLKTGSLSVSTDEQALRAQNALGSRFYNWLKNGNTLAL